MSDEQVDPDAVDLDDFGLFDPAIQQCPHAYYAKMRQEAPVFEAAACGLGGSGDRRSRAGQSGCFRCAMTGRNRDATIEG